MRVLRVAHTDVPRHALRIPLPRKDAEGQRHLLEHPSPMRLEGRVLWDAWEGDALGDHLEGSLLLLLLQGCLCGLSGAVAVRVSVLAAILLCLDWRERVVCRGRDC